MIKRELEAVAATVDNPHIYFTVKTNGTPKLESVFINGKQARREGLAGGYYAANFEMGRLAAEMG